MLINFLANQSFVLENCVIFGVFDDKILSKDAENFSKNYNNLLEYVINKQNFKGDFEEVVSIPVNHPIIDQIILIGLGKKEEINPITTRKIGAKITTLLSKIKNESVSVDLSVIHKADFPNSVAMSYVAEGISLRDWDFDKYKTKKKSEKLVKNIKILTSNSEQSEYLYNQLSAGVEGNKLTRHVVSEPPNVIYPESMAEEAKKLEHLGVRVEVLGIKEMTKLGMNALLGVGQGSTKESRLVVMQWLGDEDKKEAPLAIVGKGVTFDTGGISIKPSNNMEDMKYDMAGSGVVLGLLKTLALRKARVNVVGIMGLAENMPSGSAQRPADVVVSMSGQTIEVVNTDAEGRLVLADAIWYTQDRFKPKAIIDLATLTGAITVALGFEYAGLFSNNDELANRLFDSGLAVDEPVWRLPMGKNYDKDIDSDIADVKNVGSGRGAGSITAAQFLQRFVNDVPWVHLDIAGMAWDKKGKPLTGKGATGFGVRLLDEFLRKHYG